MYGRLPFEETGELFPSLGPVGRAALDVAVLVGGAAVVALTLASYVWSRIRA